MPSVKQGGGYTLTFAKKNQDVKDLLAKKQEIKGFVVTDYICEAIRFFEANKNNLDVAQFKSINIEHLVKQEIAKALGNPSIRDDKEISEESVDLEDNLQDIDIDED